MKSDTLAVRADPRPGDLYRSLSGNGPPDNRTRLELLTDRVFEVPPGPIRLAYLERVNARKEATP